MSPLDPFDPPDPRTTPRQELERLALECYRDGVTTAAGHDLNHPLNATELFLLCLVLLTLAHYQSTHGFPDEPEPPQHGG